MGNAGLADYWDSLYRSGQHHTLWESTAVSQDLLDLLAELALPQASRVLDIGCGSGLDACYMANQGFCVSGLDLSGMAIGLANARAAKAGQTVDFRTGNVLELPYGNAHFDLLTDRACLHLIPHQKWPLYSRECVRVLKPGAVMYIQGCADSSNQSFHQLSLELIEDNMAAAGLKVLHSRLGRLDNQAGGMPALQLLLQSQPELH